MSPIPGDPLRLGSASPRIRCGCSFQAWVLAMAAMPAWVLQAITAVRKVPWRRVLAAILWQALCVILLVRAGARLFRTRVMKSGPAGRTKKRRLFRRAVPARAEAAGRA